MSTTHHRWPALLLVGLITTAGCGDSGPGPGEPAPASASVDIGNDFFRSVANGSMNPAVDTVSVSGTVTWTWLEVGDHGVAFDDPAILPSDILFEAGSQHSVTFPTAGTFAYSCSVHRVQMRGSVVVR